MSHNLYRVGLVACAARKLPHPAPARELYVSQLFRKSAAYAEHTCDRWYILSAKQGLVHPDQVLEPYDVRLTPTTVDRWADKVRDQLASELDGIENALLVALAGRQYRSVLNPSRWPFEVPMQGRGIGRQLAWLTENLAVNDTAPG